MRHPDDACWSTVLKPEEQDMAAHMGELVGLSSPSDILRLGLQHLAKHLKVPIGNQIFALAGKRQRRSRTERIA